VKEYEVPYGQSRLRFGLRAGMHVRVASAPRTEPLPNLAAAVEQAMQDPLGSPPLHRVARPGQEACIVFTDVTRPSPDHVLVAAVLRELEKAGVAEEDVTLLCGTGLHRRSTEDEKVAKLGSEIANRFRVIDNEALDKRRMTSLGTTAAGAPVVLHRDAAKADVLVSVGLVEPHQYAGYSGGYKTAAVGAGGEAFIAYTHSPSVLDHPRVRVGRVEGNPFQEAVSEAGKMAGVTFAVNVVLDGGGRALGVAAGDPGEVFLRLTALCAKACETAIPRQYDVAIAGIGYPKDSNLYQASRAASYLHFAPTPVVNRGGYYIIPARCEEGAGTGVGERRFLSAMREAPRVKAVISRARREGYAAGAQRAFLMAKVLADTGVIIVGSEHPDLVAACKMIPADTMETALALVAQQLGTDLEVLLVPHAFHCLPVVQDRPPAGQ
jgi:nickel-dependent lactate racemase